MKCRFNPKTLLLYFSERIKEVPQMCISYSHIIICISYSHITYNNNNISHITIPGQAQIHTSSYQTMIWHSVLFLSTREVKMDAGASLLCITLVAKSTIKLYHALSPKWTKTSTKSEYNNSQITVSYLLLKKVSGLKLPQSTFHAGTEVQGSVANGH